MPKRIFMVPFARDPKFVDRVDIMVQLDQKLERQHRVALAGIGGIGKSQIAIEYCYRFRDKHPDASVFWVPCGSTSRFEQAYETIANDLSLVRKDHPKADTFWRVTDWFNHEDNGNWLMILDNADFQTFLSLYYFLPHDDKESIIITTRDQGSGELLASGEKPLIIPFLDGHMAKTLLRANLIQGIKWIEEDGDRLVEALALLPLAITQAAAFINENDISVDKYMSLLGASDSGLRQLLDIDLLDLRRDVEASNSILRTWQISFDQIRVENPRAAVLLARIVVLDRQTIPKALLYGDNKEQTGIIDAIETLQAFSLIHSVDGGETFEMHKLVQLSIREWLKMQNERLELQEGPTRSPSNLDYPDDGMVKPQTDEGRLLSTVSGTASCNITRFVRLRTKLMNWVDSCRYILDWRHAEKTPGLTYFCWTCRCGRIFNDSVREVTKGAVDEWVKSISSGEDDAEPSTASNKSVEAAVQERNASSQAPKKSLKKRMYRQSERPPSDSNSDVRAENQAERPPNAEFILLCIQQKPHRIKLVHDNLRGKLTDQDVFSSIQNTYNAFKASWWRFNRLSHVEFRKFQLYDNQHVDISFHTTEEIPVCRDLCAEGCGNGCIEYWYSPAKAKMIPPIPRTAMIHSLEEPQCRGTKRVFRAALPKRHDPLELGSERDFQNGWGLIFKDTVWEAPIVAVQMASITAAIVVAICWIRVHEYSTLLPAAFVLAIGQSIAALMQRWAESNLVRMPKDD